MSQHSELQTASEQTTSPRELRTEALAQIAANIREDSEKSPDIYLSQTEVPHGGE